MTIEPDHQPERQRFIVQTGDGEALLEYRLLQDNGIDFTRIFVPEPFRGQGTAEKLARAGLGWAREQGYEIQASCWYMARFLKRGRRA